MTNIEVGDIVEVHGYDFAPVWNGARLKVVEVHDGYYKGSVSGEVLDGNELGSIFGVTPARALFHADHLLKVESDEAPEEPSTEKPVKAKVEVYLYRGSNYHQYGAEFDSVEAFEDYQKNPFTELDVSGWHHTTKFLRLRHMGGTALIDPNDLQLVSISRTA